MMMLKSTDGKLGTRKHGRRSEKTKKVKRLGSNHKFHIFTIFSLFPSKVLFKALSMTSSRKQSGRDKKLRKAHLGLE